LADLPYPPRSGNHLRDIQTLEVLGLLGFQVSVVAGVRGLPGTRSLGPHGQLFAQVNVPDEVTSARARAIRIWRLLVRGGTGPHHPGPWGMVYEDAGLGVVVQDAVTRLQPDALILRSTLAHIAPLVRDRVSTLIFDAHDLDTLQASSLIPLASATQWLGSWARLVAGRRLDRLLRLGDEVWVPSAREVEHLGKAFPALAILIVPNGVAVPDRLPPWQARDPELLLIAGFGYPPNAAAAARLVERILPLVRKHVPAAHVTLVGRDLDPRLTARWADLPVTWLGVVDDIQPLYRRGAAVVLPYDSSTQTGTPLKLAEAMANGIPVVATPNAAGQFRFGASPPVLIAETDEALGAAVVSILKDSEAAEQMVIAAHAWAKSELAPERVASRLRLESCLGSAAS